MYYYLYVLVGVIFWLMYSDVCKDAIEYCEKNGIPVGEDYSYTLTMLVYCMLWLPALTLYYIWCGINILFVIGKLLSSVITTVSTDMKLSVYRFIINLFNLDKEQEQKKQKQKEDMDERD